MQGVIGDVMLSWGLANEQMVPFDAIAAVWVGNLVHLFTRFSLPFVTMPGASIRTTAIIAEAVGSPMEEFTPAFAGVRLYTASENLAAIGSDFPATIGEIGAIMQASNPDEITKIPTLDELISIDALTSAAGQ